MPHGLAKSTTNRTGMAKHSRDRNMSQNMQLSVISAGIVTFASQHIIVRDQRLRSVILILKVSQDIDFSTQNTYCGTGRSKSQCLSLLLPPARTLTLHETWLSGAIPCRQFTSPSCGARTWIERSRIRSLWRKVCLRFPVFHSPAICQGYT
jgi:hypothetical protein